MSNANLVSTAAKLLGLAHGGLSLDLSDDVVNALLSDPQVEKTVLSNLNKFDDHWATPETQFGDLPTFAEINGHFPNGTGGSTHDFVSQTRDGLYMGLDIIHRHGDDYTGETIDDHGVAHLQVLSGPEVVNPAFNVFDANAARDEWSFNFDIADNKETLQQVLTHENIDLKISVNGQQQTDLKGTWDAAHSQFVFVDSAHGNAILDNTGNASVTSNSENMKFLSVNPAGLDIKAGDHVDIQLVGTDIKTGTILQDTHVALDVVDHLSAPAVVHDSGFHIS